MCTSAPNRWRRGTLCLGKVFFVNRLELVEFATQVLVDFHDGRVIVELAAVVWGAEDRYELTTSEKLVSLFNDLVCSTHKVDIMFFAKSPNDILSKNVGNASVVGRPAVDLIRISPEQIAQDSLIRHVLWPVDSINLSKRAKLGRKTAVHAKDSLVDDGRDGQVVEHVAEFPPHADVVSSLALVVKAVHPGDRVAFVVAPK